MAPSDISPNRGFWSRLTRIWRRAEPRRFPPLFQHHVSPSPRSPPEPVQHAAPDILDEIARLLTAGQLDAAVRLRDMAESIDPAGDLLLARYLETVAEPLAARTRWQAAARRQPDLAEAQDALQRWTEGDPVPAQGAELPSIVTLPDLAALARTIAAPGFQDGALLRLEVAPPAIPGPRYPLLPGTEVFSTSGMPGWHDTQAPLPLPALNCYFAADAVIAGMGPITGHVWLDGRLCVGDELMPVYLHEMCQLARGGGPALRAVATLPMRTIEAPCVVLAGQGMRVYGHFVIEMLPRLLLARHALGALEHECRYLIDRDAPSWLVRILVEDLGIPRDRLTFYRPRGERVLLRRAVLPTYAYRADGFHPFAGALLDALLESLPLANDAAAGRRLFVSRPAEANPLTPKRQNRNQAALARWAAERHGFVAVSPETMPWPAQVALFRQAEAVLGLFGSGMHNALFSGPGTVVATLGMGNLAQSHIGTLRGHRNAYLDVDLDQPEFDVDPSAFAAFLDAVMAGATATGVPPPARLVVHNT